MLEIVQQQLRKKLNTAIPQSECLLLIESYTFLAKQQGDKYHQYCAKYYKANHLRITGRIEQSNILLKKSITYFKQLPNPHFLAASLNCLTTNHMIQGNTEEALHLAQQVIAMKGITVTQKARAQRNLNHFLIILRAYDKALDKSKALLNNLSLQNPKQRVKYVNILLDIAKIYLLKQMPNACHEILQKISKLQSKLQLPIVDYSLCKLYGDYHLNRNELNLAKSHYKAAILEAKSKELAPELMSARILLSDTYLLQAKIPKAEKLLLLSFNTFNRENKTNFLEVINKLVAIYQIQGKKEKQQHFEKELTLFIS